MQDPKFTVSEFIDVVNQSLDYAYSSVTVEGEVAELKTSQGKWVFFNLKDEYSSLNCFLPLSSLKVPLEDGMKIVVKGYPKILPWGKFSFTVRQIMPIGEGSIKKAFEMLKRKLEKEGLFAPERKRPLPENLTKIGVISSTNAAGYADFCKILNARWGGLTVKTAHTQVQGLDAPKQIMRALRYFNEKSEVQLIAIIRGGGSKDDLACFNDEELARAIAASKIPVITGIGHEVDESLADLVADLRGSTPSNVAELITPDKRAISARIMHDVKAARSQVCQSLITCYHTYRRYQENLQNGIKNQLATADQHVSEQVLRLSRVVSGQIARLDQAIPERVLRINRALSGQVSQLSQTVPEQISQLSRIITKQLQIMSEAVEAKRKMIARLNPELVLKQGYSIISGKLAPGEIVNITTYAYDFEAEIKKLKEREQYD